jgi:hypothetical protein
MKDINTEKIEIDGKEYTLFLNRKGIVAYERYCIEENKKLEDFGKKFKDLLNRIDSDKNPEIKDDTNPFEDLDEVDEMVNEAKCIINKTKKLYWIMLYEYHHLSINDAYELFDKAVKEYGEAQLVELGQQMIDDIQEDKYQDTSKLKNLTALKPKK